MSVPLTMDWQPLPGAPFPSLQIGLVPWDGETFGFPVAALRWTGELPDLSSLPEIQAAIDAWMQTHQVELLNITVAGDDFIRARHVSDLGFRPVDYSLQAYARRLNQLLPPRIKLRPAETEDITTVIDIAGRSFTFGRFHSDPRFPRKLADKRYRRWMERAFASPHKNEQVLVCGSLGKPTGFVHFVLREHLIDLRLLAVDPAHNNGLLGLGLLNGSLLWGRDHGARQAIAKIAAGNTDVMNLYTALGFTFRQPELVFHRHACSAPHLLP